MATQTLLTAEQFLGLPPDEGRIRELDEGRLIEMPPPSLVHMIVVATIMRLFSKHIEESERRLVCDAGTRIPACSGHAKRIPDVLLLQKEKARAMHASGGWYEGTPDLAVEVVSPTDTAEDLDRRVQQYLGAGAQAIWVVYPETRHVIVHQSDGTSPGPSQWRCPHRPVELLPGMQLPVNDLFADL